MSSDNKNSGFWEKSSDNRSKQNNKNFCNHHSNNSAAPAQPAKFKGRTIKLENHIYDISVQNQENIFANTTKEGAYYMLFATARTHKTYALQ